MNQTKPNFVCIYGSAVLWRAGRDTLPILTSPFIQRILPLTANQDSCRLIFFLSHISLFLVMFFFSVNYQKGLRPPRCYLLPTAGQTEVTKNQPFQHDQVLIASKCTKQGEI